MALDSGSNGGEVSAAMINGNSGFTAGGQDLPWIQDPLD